MKVLIACEESQTTCKAFRAKGHEAYSCDIQPCRFTDFPQWHIEDNCMKVINGHTIFTTQDGQTHDTVKDCRWDLLICHPPCTYLSNVGTRSFSLRANPARFVVERWQERAKAAVFFMRFVAADCDRIAIENPVGFMNTAYRKPDQTIHPYMFASDENDRENYVTKATCLWLKGLEPLKTNNLPKPDNAKLFGKYSSGKNRTWVDTRSIDRAKVRSKTFPGVAEAFTQWADG